MDTDLVLSGAVAAAALTFLMTILVVSQSLRLRAERRRSKEAMASAAALEAELANVRTLLDSATGQVAHYESRFAPIVDVDRELANVRAEADEVAHKISQLRDEYRTKKAQFDALVRAAAAYDEEIELAELGFYKPQFDFGTSERFKDAIKQCRERQKAMVKNKSAIVCSTTWTVGGRESEGRKMTNRLIRLTARAFNNECDAAIAKVRWNNATRVEERMRKAFEAINKLNETMAVRISKAYLDLKVEELRLTHEYQEKKQEEKEHAAELRRQKREEAKLQKDLEAALKEEKEFESLLAKAQAQAQSASDDALSSLNAQIELLQQQLERAHAASERAQSMAQQTKAGYVYVVSNLGSFGPDVYKIGMTRRLDPTDRVRELGDASVPFLFDTHAMIYCDNAPALEASLHREFDARRLNLVNQRKEFFAVTLGEIRDVIEREHPDADFVEEIEARDYRETQALLDQRDSRGSDHDTRRAFPDEV